MFQQYFTGKGSHVPKGDLRKMHHLHTIIPTCCCSFLRTWARLQACLVAGSFTHFVDFVNRLPCPCAVRAALWQRFWLDQSLQLGPIAAPRCLPAVSSPPIRVGSAGWVEGRAPLLLTVSFTLNRCQQTTTISLVLAAPTRPPYPPRKPQGWRINPRTLTHQLLKTSPNYIRLFFFFLTPPRLPGLWCYRL